MTPAIFGLAGEFLTPMERDFFRESQPFGFILFGRNVVDRAQLRDLTDELRSLVGRQNLPILIDQEGGRVARLQAPEWPSYPPAAVFGALYDRDPVSALKAVTLNYEALALDLAEVGITVTCAPVLDIPVSGAHDVIGDRAFSGNPEHVAALGQACLRGLKAGGVEGVIKHIPGHGRSSVDSHLALPRVASAASELNRDLFPFRSLCDARMAMTAHIIYEDWDPANCATLSSFVINQIIRKDIGFSGLLMSDDLDMKALDGDIGDLAAQSQAAGCDVVLNCWAKMADMVSIAEKMTSPALLARQRMVAATDHLMLGSAIDTLRQRHDAIIAERDEVMSKAGYSAS